LFYTGQREEKSWRLRGEIQRKRITKRNIFLHALCRRGAGGREEDDFDKIKNKNPTRLSSRRILGRDPKRICVIRRGGLELGNERKKRAGERKCG